LDFFVLADADEVDADEVDADEVDADETECAGEVVAAEYSESGVDADIVDLKRQKQTE
jgi:hypothetical protein